MHIYIYILVYIYIYINTYYLSNTSSQCKYTIIHNKQHAYGITVHVKRKKDVPLVATPVDGRKNAGPEQRASQALHTFI